MSFSSRPIQPEKEPLFRESGLKHFIARVSVFTKNVWKRRAEQEQEEQEWQVRTGLLKRITTILVAIFLSLLLLAGLVKAAVALKILTLSSIASFAGAELPTDEHGFTNLLLLGVGDRDHDGVDLTDTIMVASLDPATSSAVLVSLPRDLYALSTEKMGKGRINSLYRNYKSYLIGQGEQAVSASLEAIRELGNEIGLMMNREIHGVVKVNFSGFEQTIDAIGGIDVIVQEDIVDTQYPGPNYTYETFSIERGLQHLDGATALKYARSRHTTSDFSRSARQQQIVAAAAAKVKDLGLLRNVGRINQIYTIVSSNVESTWSLREMLSLASLGRKIEANRILSIQLSDLSGYAEGFANAGGLLYAPPREQFEGASVLLPASIPTFPVTWRQIHVFSELIFAHRELFIDPPAIAILNADAPEGSGRKLASELTRFGFNVVSIENYPKELPDPPASFIALAPKPEGQKDTASSLQAFLVETLKLTAGAMDPAVTVDGSSDVLIVLGEDFDFTLLQDLVEVSLETGNNS